MSNNDPSGFRVLDRLELPRSGLPEIPVSGVYLNMTQIEVAILSVKVTLLSVVVGTVVTLIGLWINNRRADKLAARTTRKSYKQGGNRLRSGGFSS